jgi:peptidoglycan L-alanyl-D-glutamate endopeptidase CwlK
VAIDSRSAKNIATLHPKLQPLAEQLIEKAVAEGINAKVIAGTRTHTEQDALYAQGRSKPGKVVTKAKGGQSIHNYGLAFDIGVFSKDGKTYLGESPHYKRVGQLGKDIGLVWGGDWKGFIDEPHFEFNHGKTIAQLAQAHNADKDVLA